MATGINNLGRIVLLWQDSNTNYESSLYAGKTYKTINVPGAGDSYASGINNTGDIAYSWDYTIYSSLSGALRHAGGYHKFDYPKAGSTLGGGINDHHVIVGYYGHVGIVHGYKATYK